MDQLPQPIIIAKDSDYMARRKTRKSTSRKTSQRSKRSKGTNTLTSAQKSLQQRQTPPWTRLSKAGYAHPIIYQFPWEDRALAKVAKAEYFPGIGYVAHEENDMFSDYLSPSYSWEQFVAHTASNDTTTPHPEPSRPYDLRPDQHDDVATILAAKDAGSPEFLIANATGTGKTVTALSAVDAMQPKSVLIVCPAAVIPVWRRHIMEMGDKSRNYVVINYESLKKLVSPPDAAVNAKKTATQNKHIALSGTPYATFDVVIIDEAHKTKNPTAQQSRICAMFAHSAKFTMRLTATPGKNPSQLHHLYRLLSFNTGDRVVVQDDKDFSRYIDWCRTHGVTGIVPAPFGNGITFEGDMESVRQMEKLLYGKTDSGVVTAIKKMPPDWDTTHRQAYPIEINSQEKKDYQLLVEDVKKIMLQSSTQRRMDMSKGIAAMMKMRQKSGLLKAPHIAEYAKYCVEDLGEQVVISTIFHNTAEVIAERLSKMGIDYVVITGKDGANEKEEKRLAFQRGDVPVVITSITTGISLHANEESIGGNSTPRRLVVADIHFSPIEHTQLEGRINRNGESGIVVLPTLSDTVDEKVVATLLNGVATQSVLQSHGDEDDIAFLAHALGVKL